ncbi:hypothetical protein [Flagellimonas sp. 2504JD4-2]
MIVFWTVVVLANLAFIYLLSRLIKMISASSVFRIKLKENQEFAEFMDGVDKYFD